MTRTKRTRGGRRGVFVPTPGQRAFVAAASAVGLPRELIWHFLPREKVTRRGLDPTEFEKHFAEELSGDPALAETLLVSRMLQRALTADGPDAMNGPMGAFRALDSWRALAKTGVRHELAVDRLTPEERAQLRSLIDKASSDDDPDA